jgi:hypothetical protein
VSAPREAITAYVERRGLKHRDHEQGVLVAFGLDGAENATVTLLLGAADDGGLRVEAAGPDPVPRDHWDNALWSLNEWNATVHVPKATLVGSASGEDDANAHIVLQAWMPFTGDVPATVVDEFLDAAISGACLFWQGVSGNGETATVDS